MTKHLNLIGVMLFLIALASFVAAVKYGGHKGGGYGFSSGL